MPEIKVEEAKKELGAMVEKEKATADAQAKSRLPAQEREALEAKQKQEREAKAKEQEAAKKDEAILTKKEEERTAEEKERAKVLLEEKRKKEENSLPAEEKLKRTQEQTQKRIDEMSNQLKQIEDKHSKEAEELHKKITILEQENKNLTEKVAKPPVDDTESVLARKENERIAKYLNEDKAKPREQRREMTKEELDEWLLEDLASAQRWISRNTLRQDRERQADLDDLKKEKWVKDMLVKRDESSKRVQIRHPELTEAVAEGEELKKQGKTKEEVRSILSAKYPKFKVMAEILDNTSEEFMYQEKAPELLAQEMERRLASSPAETPEQKKIAELSKKVEDLEAEVEAARNSDNGFNSTIPRVRATGDKLLPDEEIIVSIAREQGLPEERVQEALKSFREKKGRL